MKTRQAFVANSSSSSFIIGVSKYPTSVEEAGEVFFGSQHKFVAPIITENLFSDLKPFPLDLEKLKQLSLKVNICDMNYDYQNHTNEEEVLHELCSEFRFSEQYGNKVFWSSAEPCEFELFVESEALKLLVKQGVDIKGVNNARYKLDWHQRNKIEKKYFKKAHVRKSFDTYIDNFIRDLQGYSEEKLTLFMSGEFEDGGELGAELEHGSHWDKMPSCKRFSHH